MAAFVAVAYGSSTRLDCIRTARRQRTGTTEGEDTSPHPHSPKQADAFTGIWQLSHKSKLATKLCIGEAVDVKSFCNG